MPVLELRPREECTFDHVSLGEVMLRLDPGDMRVTTARQFRAWEGGGEYNVTRGLRRCFGLRTAIVTSLADNAVGRLVEDLMLQGGVDVSLVRWVPYDGLGRTVRNGLNFTERGFGIRGAQSVSDRGHTAASQLKPDDIDWEHIFGNLGVRWFHTGGIYAGLSPTTPDVIQAAMTAARRHGTIVSYDLNYRPSLWKSYGGQQRAQEINRGLARHVDVMIGNEEDFTACLGFHVPNTGEDLIGLEVENFKTMISEVTAEFRVSVVATTLRAVISASVNDWGAVAWSADSGFVEARHRPALEIYDRVGGGDSFASGLIYGLLTTDDLQAAVDYGAAHGALAMTTPGDTSMASLAEVEALMAGAGARVQRLFRLCRTGGLLVSADGDGRAGEVLARVGIAGGCAGLAGHLVGAGLDRFDREGEGAGGTDGLGGLPDGHADEPSAAPGGLGHTRAVPVDSTTNSICPLTSSSAFARPSPDKASKDSSNRCDDCQQDLYVRWVDLVPGTDEDGTN